LENYRLFSKKELNFNENINFIIGKNSTGKTTVLESIFFTFSGNLINDYNPITYDQRKSVISISFSFNDVLNHLDVILNSTNGRFDRIVYLNQKKVDSLKFLRERFLSPFILNTLDITLPLQDPSKKRSFLDKFLKITDEKFYKLYNDLQKLKKQKRLLLKEGVNYDILNTINSKIIECSSYISYRRIELLHSIHELLEKLCKRLWKNISNVKINYEILSVKVEEINFEKIRSIYFESLSKLSSKEIDQKKVIVSSNKDNFYFVINDIFLVEDILSQSGINMFSLILFLSLVKKIKEKYGFYPVLLMDEPFAFLDESNTLKVINFLKNYPQTIITSTSFAIANDFLKDEFIKVIYL